MRRRSGIEARLRPSGWLTEWFFTMVPAVLPCAPPLLTTACGGIVSTSGDGSRTHDASMDSRSEASADVGASRADAGADSTPPGDSGTGGAIDADSPDVCELGRYLPAADVVCTTDADCTLLPCVGCGCVVPMLGVNTTSTYRCPSLPCPPPPKGSCEEPGFLTEDCKFVPELDEVSVECLMGRCHSYATKP
jgi:hypothetical protein